MSGVTFDAGGLIAVDRNDRRVLALLSRAAELGLRITIPATALAQAMRNPARQARLSRIVRQPDTDLVALDGRDATAVGLLLARTRTADIVDAHVVVCAQRTGQAVVTSDPGDLRHWRQVCNWSWSEGEGGKRLYFTLGLSSAFRSPKAY